MSDSPLPPSDDHSALVKRNRFFAAVIILIVVSPMALAYIMHKTGWGISPSTTNKGELLQPPIALSELALSSSTFAFAQLYTKNANKKWRFLVPLSANCDALCESNLYISRQVHIRLAEKSYRVERVLLAIDPLPQSRIEQLEKEHPNTKIIDVSRQQFSSWVNTVENEGRPESYYYLVDQEGFAMMRYGDSHTGHDVLDDIKKLLKFTYDK